MTVSPMARVAAFAAPTQPALPPACGTGKICAAA